MKDGTKEGVIADISLEVVDRTSDRVKEELEETSDKIEGVRDTVEEIAKDKA